MEKSKLRLLFDEEMRRTVQPPGFKREETAHVVRHISLHNDENGFLIYSTITEENAREVIQHEKRHFANLNQKFEWKVYSYDEPVNLVSLLEDEGFKADEKEALMVIDLKEDHFLLSKDTSSVRKITDYDGICAIMNLEKEIWNESFDDLGKRLWRDLTTTDSLFIYGSYDGETLVSAAWMYLEGENFASLWGGSTLPEYRKKGHYTALLAARAKKAVEMNHSILMVDASTMSEPILKKCGFERLGYTIGMQSPGGSNED